MEEEVQGGSARGRGHGGRGTRGRGRGRCVNCGRGLDGLEDAAVSDRRGGAADRGGYGRGRGCGRGCGHGRGRGCGCGCGHGRGRVSNVDRQRLVDAFEDGDDYHELAALLSIPYQTARSMSGWRKVVYKD